MGEPSLSYKQKLSEVVNTIQFLEITSFDELFEDWVWYEKEDNFWGPLDLPSGGQISSYCLAHFTDLDESLRVEPNQKIIDYISSNMFTYKPDSIYFEVIQRKDGLLVESRNNLMTGSRWLALLPLSEIEVIKEKANANAKKS